MARPRKIDTTASSADASGSVYVFSTLACDQLYTTWTKGGADLPIQGDTVLIRGGTGIMDDRLITPLGVCTVISQEELALIENDEGFKLHKANGFIVVQQIEADPEKVAADMNTVDKSAQLNEETLKAAGGNATPAE